MADRKRRIVEDESDAASSSSGDSQGPGGDPDNPTCDETITWPWGPVKLSEPTGRSVFLMFLYHATELTTVRIPTQFISQKDLEELKSYVAHGYAEQEEDFKESYLQENAVGRLCARCGIFIMDFDKARDLEEYVIQQDLADSDTFDQELLSPYAVVLILGNPDIGSGEF